MSNFLYETSLHGIMVVEFIKTNIFQDDEKKYHDSLQARFIEGLGQFQYIKILAWP